MPALVAGSHGFLAAIEPARRGWPPRARPCIPIAYPRRSLIIIVALVLTLIVGPLRCLSRAVPVRFVWNTPARKAMPSASGTSKARLTAYLAIITDGSKCPKAFALIDTIGEQSLWFALVNLLLLTGAPILTAVNPAWRNVIRRLHLTALLPSLVLAAAGVLARLLGPCSRVNACTDGTGDTIDFQIENGISASLSRPPSAHRRHHGVFRNRGTLRHVLLAIL
jgi:hypothetical protein